MARKHSTTVEDISSYLEKREGVAVFLNNKEDRLQARLISLLDGHNLPLPKTLSDLDRDELRTAFAVCEATGVTLAEFAKMDGPYREVCLERTISAQLKKQTVTLWHHGERCYSAEGCDPVVVSDGEAHVLNAFAKAQAALQTRTLEERPSLPLTWRAQWALHTALHRAQERGGQAAIWRLPACDTIRAATSEGKGCAVRR